MNWHKLDKDHHSFEYTYLGVMDVQFTTVWCQEVKFLGPVRLQFLKLNCGFSVQMQLGSLISIT